MANDTGTVVLPPETTEPTEAETQAAIERLLEPKDPQKSDEPAETPPSEEQPPQEQPPAEPEVPPAAAESDDDDDDQALPEDVQARIDKRIAKVVAKRKELEEQLSEREARMVELEAKIKELSETPPQPKEPPRATPRESDPILQVPEIKAIYEQEQKASEAVREARDLLRRLRKEPEATLAEFNERTKLHYDADDARDWLETVSHNAQVAETRFAQQRAVATQTHVQKMEREAEKFHDIAVKAYPALTDKNSKEGKLAQEILKRFPLLNNPAVPEGWIILGDLVAGRLARESKGTAPAKPAAPPPKLATPAKAATVTRTNGKTPANALRQKAIETGDEHDVVAYLKTSPVFS